MIRTKEIKHITLHTKREQTTNDFCDDCRNMLGVYTDVLFAEDRDLKHSLGGGGEEDVSNVMSRRVSYGPFLDMMNE